LSDEELVYIMSYIDEIVFLSPIRSPDLASLLDPSVVAQRGADWVRYRKETSPAQVD
jgi:hypothetical protein